MKTTEKIQVLIDQRLITKTDLAEKLGITRKTLDVRLSKGNWKKGELLILENLFQ